MKVIHGDEIHLEKNSDFRGFMGNLESTPFGKIGKYSYVPKKMNDKIFFVHRTKYHKSDYKFHHTDSYKHSRYLSCGLSSLGHSQIAENIRCLILIF